MSSLETKVPPPAVAAAVALAMWGVSRLAPLLPVPSALRLGVAAGIALMGLAFSAAGILAFRRSRTTVNPTTPDKATSLVSSGVYRITRNPMYLGLLLELLGLAAFLANPLALLLVPAFVLYINRFQIKPEERTLSALFGGEYGAYQERVRRWL